MCTICSGCARNPFITIYLFLLFGSGVTLKHWIANNVEGGVGKYSRQSIDANISAYDLASSYMPGYETPIREGNALGIMCSYNSVSTFVACHPAAAPYTFTLL